MNRKERIANLETQIKALEMSDDRLQSNGNGNLARYKKLQEELSNLQKKWDRCQVRCIDTGEVFESSSAAANSIQCGRSAMSNHLSGRHPHVKGKRFERVVE